MGKPSTAQKLAAKPENLKRVRRCLFGKPNPNDTKKFLQEQINRIHETNKTKWNFDFEQDKPLPGKYHWHIIDSNPASLKRQLLAQNKIAPNNQQFNSLELSCSGLIKKKSRNITPKGRVNNVSSPPVKPTPGSASRKHTLRSNAKSSTPKRSVLKNSEICLIGSNSPLGQTRNYPVLSPGIIEHAGLQTQITDYAKRTRRTNSSKTPTQSPARVLETMVLE